MKKVIFLLCIFIIGIIFIPMMSDNGVNDLMLFKINEGYIKDAYELIGESKGDIIDSLAKIVSVTNDLKEYKDYKDIVKAKTYSENEISDLKKIFSCVLTGMAGTYEYKTVTESASTIYLYNTDGSPMLDSNGKQMTKPGGTTKTEAWNSTWGIKCRYPFAEGYNIFTSDDFGNERTYGGARTHEGNDLICDKGTPIINIESGYLKRIGWSDFGGWNVIIQSLDGKRRYYYAHMSKFAAYTALETKIEAGQVIGYVGDSGYGPEGTTGQFISHLHLQIEVKYEDSNELINIDPYSFLKFIESYKVRLSDNNNDGTLECDPNTEIRIN